MDVRSFMDETSFFILCFRSSIFSSPSVYAVGRHSSVSQSFKNEVCFSA